MTTEPGSAGGLNIVGSSAAPLPSLRPGPSVAGVPLINAYFKEILGKMTEGRILNVGAGQASVDYRFRERFRNTAYDTLEISAASNPTYVGDVCAMPHVPSETYDWVLAIAVVEHVRDMPAAVAEMTRVLKPGGRLYLSIPLHNEIHFGDDFADYWRVTPFGMHVLLDANYGIEEMEYWGDSMIDPVSLGVIARKGAPPSNGVSKLYYIEGGLEAIDRYIDGAQPFRWAMPIYRLRMDGIDYIRQVRAWRGNTFSQTGASVTNRDADQLLFRQAAQLEGHLIVTNDDARFERTGM